MSARPVVFDLDGTLIDSAPDIHAGVARMLASEGLEPLPLATVRGFIGKGVAALIDRVRSARGIGAEEHGRMLARFLAEYDAAPCALTRPFPGVADALATLAAAGHPLGICTNKPAATSRAILSELGLRPFFGAVVGGDSLGERKPHPEPLRHAFRLLGGSGLYVGDSEVDADTAAAASVPFLLFTRGYRKAGVGAIAHHRAFDDFALLPGLIAAADGAPS